MEKFKHFDLRELKIKRERQRTKLFSFMFEMILIFAIPAFAALYFGSRMDESWGTGTEATIPLLVFAFVMSWILFIVRYNRVSRGIKELNEAIKSKEEQTI